MLDLLNSDANPGNWLIEKTVEITGGGVIMMTLPSSSSCYTISSGLAFSGEEGIKIGTDCSTTGSLSHKAVHVFFIALVMSGTKMRMVGGQVFYYCSIY